MFKIRNKKGFTLVELLVGLMVTGIVLTAAATLAYAMGTANDASDDTSRKQAQVRYATVRISELIRYCKVVYDTSGDNIVVWKEDNYGDDIVDSNELVYIDAGDNKDYISVQHGDSGTKIYLIPQCRNVEFVPDLAPPDTKLVSISFELEENNVWHKYQISATLRCKAG